MTLKRQLLLVSVVILCLPWAGCELVREMERGMRQAQMRDLQVNNQILATLINKESAPAAPEPDARSIYASRAGMTPVVDGYGEEWRTQEKQRFDGNNGNSALAVTVRSQADAAYLYLFIEVQDADIKYHNPGISDIPNGDRIVLVTGDGVTRQRYTLYTSAPGLIQVYSDSPQASATGIAGVWQDNRQGYQLELRLPLPLVGATLGLVAVDDAEGFAGNIQPGDPLPALVAYHPRLAELLQAFASPGTRLELFNTQSQRLAAASSPNPAPPEKTFWLLRSLFRMMLKAPNLSVAPASDALPELQAALAGNLAQNAYSASLYGDDTLGAQTLLISASPVTLANGHGGAIVAARSTESYLSLTDQALNHAITRVLLAVALAVGVLVAYAAWLSWRIRRLSVAASTAIDERGALRKRFQPSRQRDELGELSRRYSDLLDQVSEHHDYLRTLNSKLSHELRTPIAIIRSSLEHMDHADAAAFANYQQRASDGLDRLGELLTRMSEASALQQSIDNNPKQDTPLNTLLQQLGDAYRVAYSNHHIDVAVPDTPIICKVNADLLVQMLDKLMDNAASFAPAQSTIALSLTASDIEAVMTVSNHGSALPDTWQGELFEPMTSHRDAPDGNAHLGLGLHVVRLICDYHDGHAQLRNRDDEQGVDAIITLPRA